MAVSRKGPKKITSSMRLSEQGVNLIQRIVLEMGFMWYPTGGVEAGIDGTIELINPTTEEALNSVILVQSKATARTFEAETDTTLEYTCKERDLNYWLLGNAPVIIVVSRPATNEAYWISIKDYFKDLAALKSSKIRFDKRLNRFDENSKDTLLTLAVPKDAGVYFAPPPITERLYSNLLRVTRFAETIYAAETEFRLPGQLIGALKEHEEHPSYYVWFLQDKRVYTFHNLVEEPWKHVCDTQTIEVIPSSEWAYTDDPVRSRHFVRLLQESLRDKLGALGIRYNRRQDCLYFRASDDLSPRTYQYMSFQNKAKRIVVTPINLKSGRTVYRHNAFVARFRRFDSVWYLEITPTYYFTTDGKLPWRYYEEWLKGIKRIEKNAAVVGQVIMWARRLAEPMDFLQKRHPFIGFGELEEFTLDVGIKDALWSPTEQSLEAERLAELLLGDEDSAPTELTVAGADAEIRNLDDDFGADGLNGESTQPGLPYQRSFLRG